MEGSSSGDQTPDWPPTKPSQGSAGGGSGGGEAPGWPAGEPSQGSASGGSGGGAAPGWPAAGDRAADGLFGGLFGWEAPGVIATGGASRVEAPAAAQDALDDGLFGWEAPGVAATGGASGVEALAAAQEDASREEAGATVGGAHNRRWMQRNLGELSSIFRAGRPLRLQAEQDGLTCSVSAIRQSAGACVPALIYFELTWPQRCMPERALCRLIRTICSCSSSDASTL